ncbi:radical SAM peptide maturase [Tannerella forsythia]|uniref:radical SAM peptide maturase n=1 Tax=Tannerella forsythia TaxID=28112 RepID=UPI0028E9563D|nr:radical SAM peptide maturase [Tannerella forsythia]
MLKNNIIFFSNSGNSYLFSYKDKEFIPLHPVLKSIILLKQQDITDNELYSHIELESYPTEIIKRYIDKYNYLVDNTFLTNEDIGIKEFGKLNKHIIDRQINDLKVLTFEVTDKCNLRCRYCAYGDMYSGYDERKSKNMSFETAKHLLDYLFNRWENSISISEERNIAVGFYGGEPLMNFKLIQKIVEYISKNLPSSINVMYNMTTNALLLDRHIDYLIKHNFKLLVRLDGAEEDNCERVTPKNKNSFSIIYRNLKNIQITNPEYFKKNIAFNSVFHSKSDVNRIVDFFKREFDKTTQLSEINNSGIKDEKKFSLLQKSVFKSIDNSSRSLKIDKELMYNSPRISNLTYFLHHLSNEVYKDYRLLLYGDKKYSLLNTGSCVPFERKMYLTVNGRILVCERIDHEFSVGYVTENGVELDTDKIAKKYNYYCKKLHHQCRSCYSQASCSQCMFYLNIKEKNVKCHNYKSGTKFAEYLSLNVTYLENNSWAYKRVMNEITIF